MVDIAPLNGAQ